MDLKQAKEIIEKQRQHLADNQGKACLTSANGPVAIQVIDALFAVVEALDARLAAVEKSVGTKR
jgi:hypothetical protein